MKGDNISL